jgi:hypothetical protein
MHVTRIYKRNALWRLNGANLQAMMRQIHPASDFLSIQNTSALSYVLPPIFQFEMYIFRNTSTWPTIMAASKICPVRANLLKNLGFKNIVWDKDVTFYTKAKFKVGLKVLQTVEKFSKPAVRQSNRSPYEHAPCPHCLTKRIRQVTCVCSFTGDYMRTITENICSNVQGNICAHAHRLALVTQLGPHSVDTLTI